MVSMMVCGVSMFSANAVGIDSWQPEVGDTFEVDVTHNVGYLVHSDGLTYSFPVVTGQKRNVYYLGRYYFAGTPLTKWQVNSDHILSDRYTFGKTGEFLRLYKNGETRTSYGIHSHKYADYMLESDMRYRSMGCVIASDENFRMIEQTYRVNGDNLNVVTYMT